MAQTFAVLHDIDTSTRFSAVSLIATLFPLIINSPSSQVSVNGVEVRAVKPGVYRHTITGINITSDNINIRVPPNIYKYSSTS